VAGLKIKITKTLLITLIAALVPFSAHADIVKMDFHWSAPVDGSPVDHYNVYVAVEGNPFELVTTALDTTYTLDVEYDLNYQIRVSGVSEHDIEGPLSISSESLFIPAPQPEQSILVPPNAGLLPNYPNPFNPETTISYGIPEAEAGTRTMLEIYSVKGERLRSFATSTTPGWHNVSWNGRDEQGMMQPSGKYFVRYACGSSVKTWPMTMVK
jgi:hypothetical protein